MAGSGEERSQSSAVAARAEQIRTLYRQSAVIVTVNPLNAAIVAAVLWRTTSQALLVAWVTAMVAVTVARVALRSRYLRALPPEEEAAVWARKFVTGATASGILWGLGGTLFYDSRVPVPQLLLIFVIGGMVAGAAGTLALHLPAFFGFASAAVLPTAVRILVEADRLHAAMGTLAIIYGLAMALVAANNHRAVTEALRLRFENQDLLNRLSHAQISLADANRTLEQRVAERSAALERQTEALRDAQRMESVGLLAGGIAHDFNNLLTVVLGNLELLLDTHEVTGEGRRTLEVIGRAANRAAALVSQLLAFSRRQVMVRRILDLNGVVSDVQPLLSRLIGEHIELVVAMHTGPLSVMADPVQLQQVIINLATNARDAMATGGKLTIETELFDGTLAGTTIPPGRYAILSVRDTGIGMDPETKRMVFHPFFTTKEVGRGTGLGLATVYGIVEQSEGHILVESAPGRGSCFRVLLPQALADAPEPLGTPSAKTLTRAPRAATVLVAEDESSVRALTAQTLTAAGFNVIEAENGEHALEIARRHKGPIDLLISDVLMPRMGGIDLANCLAAEQPGIRILLVSGYSREQLIPTDDSAHAIGFLQKPFTPRELIDKAAQLLANRAAAQHAP